MRLFGSGGRNAKVAEVRAALVVKRDPRLDAFDFQILEIDVALQFNA